MVCLWEACLVEEHQAIGGVMIVLRVVIELDEGKLDEGEQQIYIL